MDKNIALKVENLSVEINNQKIVENLSFELKKGETLIILGPNGAGKTTLLRALLELTPYTGKVIWNTKKLSYLPPNELMGRKEILPLTTEDFYGLKEISKKKSLESLMSVGLTNDIFKKRISALSTGQFQRLSIAWALVDNPDTLLFDEPTSGIDIGGTETIYSLLHGFWKKRKMNIVLVTHDLSVVWEHADNVLCLNKKNVCYGPPNKTLTAKNLKSLYGSEVRFHKH